ncbi:MAG TPA: potassium channel family protein [Bryobacteraceae bacterium]|nr:potassium channel family protein [Bryobacteraceae bacterium]
MRFMAAIAGCLVVVLVLADAFHTIVLARRTRQSFRITRLFYKLTWTPFAAAAKHIRSGQRREGFLGVYGPLSLLLLFALWAIFLVAGFALLQWAIGLRAGGRELSLGDDLYLSATTLFTLGTGDPLNTGSRIVTVIEGGTGFMLLGLVIGYLPVFYQAFSEREVQISLLDARAGSPPAAAELLRLDVSDPGRIERYLERSEKWAAEILESHLSFPMLAWFRSHHANQSWLSALTALADCAAVISLCAEGDLKIQAELTLAMGTHALADIRGIFDRDDVKRHADRLSDADISAIREVLGNREPLDSDRLDSKELRRRIGMYESHAQALSAYLLMGLPSWTSQDGSRENWRTAQKPGNKDSFTVSDPFRS